jgi:AAA+ ATPase superfamily predicted ATPase
MRIETFSVKVLKEILHFHKKSYKAEDLLALWAFTGGVAKYVALLMDAGATDFNKMLQVAIDEDSFFLEEGKVLLGDEFGKDYSIYFSILSAISRGVTTRNEIEQVVGRQIGGYLTRLEGDYHLVSKRLPFGAKTARQVRYQIDDPFYRFWFRFIFKYDYMVQMKSFELLRKIVARDYPVFSGFALERYFQKKMSEEGLWSRIGSWWDRKGEKEIDLIAESELDGRSIVCEVKRDKSRIDLDALKTKFAVFANAVGGKWKRAKPDFLALSMEDM